MRDRPGIGPATNAGCIVRFHIVYEKMNMKLKLTMTVCSRQKYNVENIAQMVATCGAVACATCCGTETDLSTASSIDSFFIFASSAC